MDEGGKRRGPGAPLGNTNAVKHGFYSRRLPHNDAEEMETYQAAGLEAEAMVLRVVLRRVFERMEQADSLEENLRVLRGMSFALSSLARLMRTNLVVNPKEDDLGAVLTQVIAEVLGERGEGESGEERGEIRE